MKEKTTDIWALYKKGKEHHTNCKLYSDAERCNNFYNGDQWKGLEADGEELPILNFIKPIGKYKISMIAQNQTSIVYSPMGENDSLLTQICERLTTFAASQWEKAKMDTLIWKTVKNAFISGSHYCYCYEDSKRNLFSLERTPCLKMSSVNSTNIYFSDEESPNLNEQEWIIISERVSLKKVLRLAKENGLRQDELAKITPDEDISEGDTDKCTSLLYMEKTEHGIVFCRSVKNIIYVKKQLLKGLDLYPVVGMRWEEQQNNSRGVSGVFPLIANQLEVNKTAARRAIAVKRFSFPTLVYNENKIANVDELSKIGASIAVENMQENPISSIIQYLNPAPISNDAQILQAELIHLTRDLEGASDAVMGQIDPTKASGEAIKAVRDQASIVLNEQAASFKQFVEDIALLWYKLFICYCPNGLLARYEQDGEVIDTRVSSDTLLGLELLVRVDVSPIDPYSRLSQETALERLLASKYITFEEYVEALDQTSSVPKGKLKSLLQRRSLATQKIDMEENNYEMQAM